MALNLKLVQTSCQWSEGAEDEFVACKTRNESGTGSSTRMAMLNKSAEPCSHLRWSTIK